MVSQTVGLYYRCRLPTPAFPLKMSVGVFEVCEAQGVVLQTVRKRPLQGPGVNLPRGEEPLGFDALVPRVSREALEVPLLEHLPGLKLEHPRDRGPELFDRLLVLAPAGPGRDQLPRQQRQPVGDDLPASENVENEQLLLGRVDLDGFVLVPGRKLVAAGLDRDDRLFVGRPLLPPEKRVLPEDRVPEGPQMGPLLFDDHGRDLPGRLGDLAVGPPRKPRPHPGVGFLHRLEVPSCP